MINFIDEETQRRIKEGVNAGVTKTSSGYTVRYWNGKKNIYCGTFGSLYKAIRERILYEYQDSRVYEKNALLTRDAYLNKKFKKNPELRIEAARRAAVKFKEGASISDAAYQEKISVMYLINFIRHKKCKDKINKAYQEIEQYLISDKSYMKPARKYSSDLYVHNDIATWKMIITNQLNRDDKLIATTL